MCTGNKGNRSSANKYLKLFLERGFAVGIFDYNGLGHSEKLPISYGYYESNDLDIFINLINEK
jgi:alpha/beta superfamily hydrolase